MEGVLNELQVEWGLTDEEWKKQSLIKINKIIERREAKSLGERREAEKNKHKT